MSDELNFLSQFNNSEFADAVLCVREEEGGSHEPRLATEQKEVDVDGNKGDWSGPGRNPSIDENDEIPSKRRKVPSPCPSDSGSDTTICYIDENVTTLPIRSAASPTEESQPFVSSNSNVDNQLKDVKNSDTQIKKYYVHCFLLAAHSKYFHTLFLESDTVANKLKEIDIEIPEEEFATFQMLLKAIYSKEALEGLSIMQIVSVILLANKFKCDIVIKQCLVHLTEMDFTTSGELNSASNCFTILFDQKHPSAEILQNYLHTYINDYFTPDFDSYMSRKNVFEQITVFSLETYAFMSIHLSSCSGNSLLSCLVFWAETNKASPTTLDSILKLIKKEKVSSNFLNDVITPHHPILSEAPSFKQWFYDALQYHSFPDVRKKKSGGNKIVGQMWQNAIDHSYKFKMELTPQGESADIDNESMQKIYTKAGSELLCEGYFIDFQILVCKNDVSMKLKVPGLIGVNGEAYLSLIMDIHLKQSKIFILFSKDVLFTRLADFDKEIPLGKTWHEQFTHKEIHAKLIIKVG